MRNWPADIITQLQAEGYRPHHLVAFDFSTTLRYTNCDIPLSFSGDLYNPRAFNIPEISYSIDSSVDKIGLEIDMADRDATLLEEFIGGTPGDIAAHVYLQVLDADMQEISTTVLFQGKIDSYDYKSPVLRVSIASFHSLWNKRTMEKSTPTCRRNFKQSDCGYGGAESWCDRSWKRCTALNNTARFNGFRFLPELEDAVIWWGQEFSVALPVEKVKG
jgi:hypothetical protein